MAKYQQYAEYKDSGVDWLGSIPKGWKLKRIQELTSVINGYPFESSKFNPIKGMPLVRIRDIRHQKTEVCFDGAVPEFAIINDGDILIGMDGDFNVAKWTGGKAALNQRVACIRHEDPVIQSFLYYLLPYNMKVVNDLTYYTTVKHLSTNDILKTTFAIPCENELSSIVSFLDHETAQIDTLIDKQQNLIQLLKEKRQAVISHAVTKGLNPNARMKDSGVEWLGEVPEHWEFIKFDYVINAVGDIDHYMPKSIDSGIPYVMTGDLRALVSEIDFENCKQVAYSDYVKLSRKIKASKDDIIFARYATIGTLSYVDIDADFLVSYSCVTIKPNAERTSGRYLFRYLKSQAFLQAITMYINSNTQGNVGIDSLRNVKVIMPPLSEQEEIISFLNDKVMKIDQLINKAKSAITLMQERRTALISAAVTGKIDVRGWVESE